MTIIQKLARKVFGTQNDRELKSIFPLVEQINAWEKEIQPLTDGELQHQTVAFRERLAKGEALQAILPEAFAVVREAAWRVIGQRHYDVQLIGGISLHRGKIAEMRTGEGKTLVATLPCYLNALEGKGVHVVTVNDYLAKRDANWMGQIYQFLGMSTGVITHDISDRQRKINYGCDITYGTNNEFGFDYLRDNMKFRLDDYVQRDLHYAIVDEVDSILIDEARTPLIISGPTDDATDLYGEINQQLKVGGGLKAEQDYTIDEKSKTAALSESGIEVMENRLQVDNLYDPQHIQLLHHVNQALRAHVLFKRDVDYVVRNNEVMIVDEFTGRLMPGRRWSDGLHQAIEAKEGVTIENENQTLATITFQNYFRMYKKLSGMTGTADTEATEFKQIYQLDVTVIPPNRDMIRLDHADIIFKSEGSKLKAIITEIEELRDKGQPILVGTVSVDKSEKLSHLLKEQGIAHHVLNAKQHEREAEIIAQAGRKGALTISTNMAGRGTDILLGGNPEYLALSEVGLAPGMEATAEEQAAYVAKQASKALEWKEKCQQEREEVKALGGLFILGTERHESRRIDNQLRGRAGRQGDPGESRFYLSLDDDLMRIFGGEKIGRFMEEDVPIEAQMISNAIKNAQRKVEGHNYDIRKHLLEYDDVMNQQRKVVYAWRKEALTRPNLEEMFFSMIEESALKVAEEFFPQQRPRTGDQGQIFDATELNQALFLNFHLPANLTLEEITPFNQQGLQKQVLALAEQDYRAKEQTVGPELLHDLKKMLLLSTIDHLWKDHLLAMDHLRDGISLQGYGQKDPLIEYKKQGFGFFQMMMEQITWDVIRKFFSTRLDSPEIVFPPIEELEGGPQDFTKLQLNVTRDGQLVAPGAELKAQEQAQQLVLQAHLSQRQHLAQALVESPTTRNHRLPELDPRIGRNDPCPCGSGKKFKKCHGS